MAKDEAYFDIPVNISDPLEQRIFDAFTVYDHNNVNMVDATDIGNILRFLGCVPSDEDIREIVKQTEFANHPGNIHLSNFMPHLKNLLYHELMKPSSAEDILKAFKVFDPKNKGFIDGEIFQNIMAQFGDEPLMMEEMIKSAMDPTDNKVYYEIYINKLIHEPEDSIYTLSKQLGEPRRSSMRKMKQKLNKK